MALDTIINVWQYSRWVYLIGRSVKYRPFTQDEKTAAILFITSMTYLRPGVAQSLQGKIGNALDITGVLTYQNDYTLGKMIQKIGKDMKVKFPVVGEKAICDALFASTDKRRYQTYNNYVTDVVPEESSTSSDSSSSN